MDASDWLRLTDNPESLAPFCTRPPDLASFDLFSVHIDERDTGLTLGFALDSLPGRPCGGVDGRRTQRLRVLPHLRRNRPPAHQRLVRLPRGCGDPDGGRVRRNSYGDPWRRSLGVLGRPPRPRPEDPGLLRLTPRMNTRPRHRPRPGRTSAQDVASDDITRPRCPPSTAVASPRRISAGVHTERAADPVSGGSHRHEELGQELIDIAPGNPDALYPYENLLPVVELLIANGNRFTAAGNGFQRQPHGWVCELELPLDFDLLTREVTFPPIIKAGPQGDGVLDMGTWCLISGPGERASRIVMPKQVE